jgi:hypothetical protein
MKEKKTSAVREPESIKSKKARQLSNSQVEVETEEVALIEAWKHEISELKLQRFATVDEAVSGLCKIVLRKLRMDDSPESLEYLQLVFKANPEIQAQIASILVNR